MGLSNGMYTILSLSDLFTLYMLHHSCSNLVPVCRAGIGGFSASLVTQLVVVPIDVISSRLMVQNTGVTSVKYKGGFDALQTIIRSLAN